ncbi:MAG: exodeoxyribonuclease V subunit gamma, partial [Acidimicrobiales bacterium]
GPRPERTPLADGDDSLRVHSCHGRARQVDVMRDAVLHLLADDETLEPRDVVIMCPDIESFAPLVTAAFGATGEDPSDPSNTTGALPRLRLRLADRSIRQTNPLLAVAARLLALAAGRTTASDVLDLAACEAVSRPFGFDDESLSHMARWIADAGIRWGLDAGRRAPWSLQDEPANTWTSGLDRLLLGAAMSEDGLRLFGGVLPFDDVSGASVDLAGRLAEFVDRLRMALDALAGPQSVTKWVRALAEATESLAVAAPHESWQHDQLRGLLDGVAEEADVFGDGPELDLAEIAALLEDRLRGRPTRANFRTGDLTVCTLVPMRSVPHRVVGLLGLDDGVFPRQSTQDGDNLLLDDPRVGERDPRSEDRQLLLDALLAAGDHLIITYEGRDLRTNQVRPPSVPVAELLDVVDSTVGFDTPGSRPRDRVVVEHPLQPFDPRNFTPGCLGQTGPFGFDPMSLDGARAQAEPPLPPAPFLSGPLAPTDSPVVQLDSLVRFLEHPVKAFLRDRLHLYEGGEVEVVKDEIPIDLDPLEKWGIGDRLLGACLDGIPIALACDAERARGSLPPGRLADAVLDTVVPVVQELTNVVQGMSFAPSQPETLPVHVVLPDDRLVIGAVSGVRDGVLLRVNYSRLASKHRVAAWARFLAVAASTPDRDISAVTIGRSQSKRRPVHIAEIAPLNTDPKAAADAARELLMILVDLYDRGLREPLPLYCETSAAWATAEAKDEDPSEAARRKWKTDYGALVPNEDGDASHVRVLGADAPFESLLAAPPGADESGPGWADDSCRLAVLAQRMWDPILEHERVTTR